MKALVRYYTIAVIISLYQNIFGNFDNYHFYRAQHFASELYEPRVAKDWLTSFDIWLGAGRAKHSHNDCGKTLHLFDIYGSSHLENIGCQVPGKNLNCASDLTVTNLYLDPIPVSGLEYRYTKGSFRIAEAGFSFIQNLTRGFFVQAYLPVRSLRSKIKQCTENVPGVPLCCTPLSPFAQTFVNSFDSIMSRYNISLQSRKQTGAGDLSLLLGYTYSYQGTATLDFIDAGARFGVLIPTSPAYDPRYIFNMPLGYHHAGFPFLLQLSIGAFEWLTVGADIGAIIFSSRTENIRIATAVNQPAWLRLTCTQARVRPGPILNGVGYVKADHICRGLSFWLAYSVAHQNKTDIWTDNSCLYNNTQTCYDPVRESWTMHVIHLMVEYDFTPLCAAWGMRLGLFYDIAAGGRRNFMASVGGGTCGLDIAWHF